jgi:hypothetical protein
LLVVVVLATLVQELLEAVLEQPQTALQTIWVFLAVELVHQLLDSQVTVVMVLVAVVDKYQLVLQQVVLVVMESQVVVGLILALLVL